MLEQRKKKTGKFSGSFCPELRRSPFDVALPRLASAPCSEQKSLTSFSPFFSSAALKARIAVLISGSGTNLQAVLDAQASGVLNSGEVALVLSNRKAAYGLERARLAGIETAVLSKVMEPDDARRDEVMLAILKERRIDVILLAGFLGILGDKVLSAYENRIVNIHPALIPSFCGMGYYGLRVHEAVLAHGVKVTGATAHLVTRGVDEGPILYQKAVDVLPDDTPETLQKRVMVEAEWVLLPKAAEFVCAKLTEGKETERI